MSAIENLRRAANKREYTKPYMEYYTPELLEKYRNSIQKILQTLIITYEQ